jgi:Fur family transcriptional regulator, peroxide stress response regulator
MKRQRAKQTEAEVDEIFVAHCRARGLAVTEQRRAIFAALAASREHPSAEQLFQSVRDRLPNLSLATVYKNLESLRAIGAVSDVNSLHDQGRYEASLPGTGAGDSHHHLVCIACKKVLDIGEDELKAPELPAGKAYGFAIRAIRVQVEGLCPDCQRAG